MLEVNVIAIVNQVFIKELALANLVVVNPVQNVIQMDLNVYLVNPVSF